MAFTPNNNFNANQNNGGEKKKTNFRLGKIWGSDGQMDVSVWVADTGVRAILTIKQAVGKDPSTGASVLEQKQPSELPRYFLNADYIRAILAANERLTDPGSVNIVIDKGQNGGKLSIIGSGNSIKITIESSKNGSRTMTLDSVSVGSDNIHAGYLNLIEYLKIALKKAMTQKLDPEEFGMALQSSDDDNLPI